MWLVRFLTLFSVPFCICYGQEFSNSSAILNVGDNLINSTNTYFNYTGNINRIVGGRPLNIIEAPYQVAVYNDNFFICGGSIISADWVLTAAHCLKGGGTFKIRAGSRFRERGGVVRYARYVIVNSGYNLITLDNDIGLIRLKRRLKFSPKIRPVRLAKPNFKLPQKYLVSGWGSLRETSSKPSNVLRGVTVARVSHRTCRNKFRREFPVTRLVICAASPAKDACEGDSGGPLTNNGFQYGIVSYGIGCARRAFPGVYTNTRRQFAWVRNVIRRFGGLMPRYLLT
ncbi:trypsin alpha-like [Lucilia sericata]|uniref:trypsin alpha-like n=1 Tax=Lucilia sericata TaxID=13632 RepID=UPI0018A80347|nr:trypsin alpha-like [Lucilia sericata]